MEPPPESSPLLDSSSVGIAASRRIGSAGSRYDYAELAELHNVEAPSSVVPLPTTGPRKKQQLQQQEQKQRQGPTLFCWAGRSRSKAESSPVTCCGCKGTEFIHDFPCVCAPCGLYFCKASCMKDRHLHLVGGRACILSLADPAAAAAVRAEVRWRLRERRPLQDDSPEPRTRLLDPLAIRALSVPKDCRSQIAAVAACIRTAVGGREGFNRVVDAVEVDRGKACCVCGHQVLILGFAYPSTGALPAAPVPQRTKKRAKAQKPAPGGAAAAGPPPVDKAQPQAPPQEFTVEDLDIDRLLCCVCGAWQQLWHDQQQQHQHQHQQHQHRALPPLRSLVPKPGLALIRVSALSSLQQLLLKEALSQLTVCGQQALVQPLQWQVPRCEALADFLRRLDEEDARRQLVQRQRQPKQPEPEPDSDAEPEPGLEAPVWDADQLVAELRYFDEFSEDDAAAMAELMQQPGGLLPGGAAGHANVPAVPHCTHHAGLQGQQRPVAHAAPGAGDGALQPAVDGARRAPPPHAGVHPHHRPPGIRAAWGQGGGSAGSMRGPGQGDASGQAGQAGERRWRDKHAGRRAEAAAGFRAAQK